MERYRIENHLPIAYYDGRCNFCFGLVQQLQKFNLDRKVNLIPFQLVSSKVPEELLIISNSESYEADKALIKLLKLMGGLFYLPAFILMLLPPFLLKKLYYALARNRYQWFGTTSCTIN